MIGSEILRGGAEVIDSLGAGTDKSISSLLKEQKDKRLQNIKDSILDKVKAKMRGEGLRSLKNKRWPPIKIIRASKVGPGRRRKAAKSDNKKKIRKTKKSAPKKKKKQRKVSIKDIFD